MSDRFREQAVNEFDKWSSKYDHPGFFQRNLFIPTQNHIIAEMLRIEKPDAAFSFLDIGCGTGTLVMRVHEKFPNARLAGVDLSEGMVKVASSKARPVFGAANNPNVSFCAGNASSRLPFSDGQFDYVACCHSFHHYPDQFSALKEFRRLLKPGGKILFVDSNINRVWGFVMHQIIIGTYEKFQVKHHWAGRLRRLFEQHGFRVERQDRRGLLVPWMMTLAVAVE